MTDHLKCNSEMTVVAKSEVGNHAVELLRLNDERSLAFRANIADAIECAVRKLNRKKRQLAALNKKETSDTQIAARQILESEIARLQIRVDKACGVFFA
jgi:16S rRNA U1498 N3-methylase RsmE